MENSGTVASTREALARDVNDLRRDANQIVQDVRDHTNAQVEAAKQRVDDALSSARSYASAHVLTVLAAGIVIGFLFGARRSS